MSNNKQSSVDILCQSLARKLGLNTITFYIDHQEEIKQAKAMHRDEIMEARTNGRWACTEKYGEIRTNIKYYNETFGGNNDQ
jgi:hypothetical protein